MDRHLQALGYSSRPFAARLNLRQVPLARGAAAKRGRKEVRGGDRILDGEVDADPAHRRHRVGGIADAKESRPSAPMTRSAFISSLPTLNPTTRPSRSTSEVTSVFMRKLNCG